MLTLDQIKSPSISEFQIGSKESLRCLKSRFPIQIIVFDKHELILFVNQGLTLSTGSLVSLINPHPVVWVHVQVRRDGDCRSDPEPEST